MLTTIVQNPNFELNLNKTPLWERSGIVTTDLGANKDDYARSVAIDPSGRIVVAGYTQNQGNDANFALARYTADGALDTTFGDTDPANSAQKTGIVITDLSGNKDDYANSVAIDPSGRIVVAGLTFQADNYTSNFALVRYTADGELDTTFGDTDPVNPDKKTGIVITDLDANQNDEALSVAIDPSGRIVVAGLISILYDVYNRNLIYKIVLTRYTADGALDTDFGDMDLVNPDKKTGIVTTDFIENHNLISLHVSVAIDPSGRIVVAGSTITEQMIDTAIFALARYTAAGELDTTFGDTDPVNTDKKTGIVITDLDANQNDEALSVAIDPSGRIVVAALTVTLNEEVSNDANFALARYTAAGELDTTFGNTNPVNTDKKTGIVITDLGANQNDEAFSVAIDPSGRIVVAGLTENEEDSNTSNFALVRYTADGELDTTFGDTDPVNTDKKTGIVITDLGANKDDYAYSLAIDPSGRIVVAGLTYNGVNNDSNFALACYTTLGELDTTFGRFNNSITTIHADPTGRLLVAGQYNSSDPQQSVDFALVRYTAAGALDNTFGDTDPKTGIVTTDISGNRDDYVRCVAMDSEGRIVVAGYIGQGSSFDSSNFALVRYLPDGTLDNTFGGTGTGIVITDVNSANSVAIDSQGRIVVAGITIVVSDEVKSDFAVLRYLTDGTLDTTFGDPDPLNIGQKTGIVITDLSYRDNAVSVVIDSINRIVVAGVGGDVDGITFNFVLTRYTADGALDKTFGKNQTGIVLAENSAALSVALDSQSRILVAGYSSLNFLGSLGNSAVADFTLLRYGPDGILDETFANKGTYKFNTTVQKKVSSYPQIVIDNNDNIWFISQSLFGVYKANETVELLEINNNYIYTSITLLKSNNSVFVLRQTLPLPLLNNNDRSLDGAESNNAIFQYQLQNVNDVICLVAGTPVAVDQTNQMQKGAAPVAAVAIEHLRPGVHRIGGRAIAAISQTAHDVGYLVCFEPHCLAINLPSARTVMTHIHHVAYKGRMVPAKDFVGRVKGVRQIPCAKGEWVYNVLLEGPQKGLMKVNNMVLETLDPQSRVARLLTKHF